MYKVVIGSKYTQDGHERTRWVQHGEAYERNGNLTVRLDYPIFSRPGQSTWLNLFKKGEPDGIPEKNDEAEK